MRGKSKYEGGFEERNGRKNNTSEYNHNYYVRNKEKWRKKYNKLQDWLGFDERDARDESKEQFDDAWIDYMISQHKYIGLSGDVIEKGRKYYDAGNAFYYSQRVYSETFLGKLEQKKRDALKIINKYHKLHLSSDQTPWVPKEFYYPEYKNYHGAYQPWDKHKGRK